MCQRTKRLHRGELGLSCFRCMLLLQPNEHLLGFDKQKMAPGVGTWTHTQMNDSDSANRFEAIYPPMLVLVNQKHKYFGF